jgi:hypothetical protein
MEGEAHEATFANFTDRDSPDHRDRAGLRIHATDASPAFRHPDHAIGTPRQLPDRIETGRDDVRLDFNVRRRILEGVRRLQRIPVRRRIAAEYQRERDRSPQERGERGPGPMGHVS